MDPQLRQAYEQEARLHEEDANAISSQSVALRRRAEMATRLAAIKRDQALAMEKDHERLRLEREATLADRESEIMLKEVSALDAERERALAQAATARRKASLP